MRAERAGREDPPFEERWPDLQEASEDATHGKVPLPGAEPPATSEIPAWLMRPEGYEAPTDNDRFLHKNERRLAAVLSNVRLQRGGLEEIDDLPVIDRALARVDAAVRLLGLIVTIVCVSAATNMFFVYTVLGAFLAALALRDGKDILDVLKPALASCAIAALVMLPAVFLGQPSSMARVAVKVFVSIGLVISLSRSVAHNRLIAGLRFFHIPDMIVFILDITMKYIVMLGDVASQVLEAVMLRSVGRNGDKNGSMSGILGVTFLKAHDFADEMYEAMECRGFSGTYVVPRRRVIDGHAVWYIALIVMEIAFFLVMEGAMG